MKSLLKEELLKLVPLKNRKDFKLSFEFETIDWNDTDFLGWIHPSGHLGYILEDLTGTHRLWIFDCNPKQSSTKRAAMCSICFSIQKSQPGTKIFSHPKLKQKNHSYGQYICSDLNCNKWVRVINQNTMREDLSIEERRLRMLINLEKFLDILGR